MQEVSNWSSLFYNSLQTFGQKLMSSIPYILGVILILLVGWIIARLFSKGVAKVLHLAKFDTLSEKVNTSDILKKANITASPSELVGKFVYWIIMLLVITTAADSLGWEIVSIEISKLMTYLPKLFVAIVIFIIGTTIATIVRDVIKGTAGTIGISSGNMIGEFVFYLLFIVVTLTALGQAGIDTSIITANLLLILGAILITAAISYGFASREILANILASYFNKRTFQIGQTIQVESLSGKIVAINGVSFTIQNGEDLIVIPSHKIIENNVIIKG